MAMMLYPDDIHITHQRTAQISRLPILCVVYWGWGGGVFGVSIIELPVRVNNTIEFAEVWFEYYTCH